MRQKLPRFILSLTDQTADQSDAVGMTVYLSAAILNVWTAILSLKQWKEDVNYKKLEANKGGLFITIEVNQMALAKPVF